MTEEKALIKPHTVLIKSRSSLTLTGINDIESFNEEQVLVYTAEGELVIGGQGLHIGKIDVDLGELTLVGQIDSLEYTDNPIQGKNIWEKLFR
ncbi:MAG: sporulation protein YabP [Oscillospiraceae bacterium]